MVLAELEDLFVSWEQPYEKDQDGDLILPTQGKGGANFSIVFTDDGEGWLLATASLPSVGTEEFPEFDNFARAVAHKLRYRMLPVFLLGCYHAQAFMLPETAEHEIRGFTWSCSRFQALLEQVVKTGKWSEDLIDFTFNASQGVA